LKSQATLQKPLEKDHYFFERGVGSWEISNKRIPAQEKLLEKIVEKKDEQVFSMLKKILLKFLPTKLTLAQPKGHVPENLGFTMS